jgi:hypothetical protein
VEGVSLSGLALLVALVAFLISRKRAARPRCPHCLKTVEVGATRCPHCAGSFTEPLPARAPAAAAVAFWVVIGAVLALGVILAVVFFMAR